MYSNLPKLIRFLLSLFVLEIIIFTLFRVVFLIAFSKYGQNYSTSDILYSFWIGFRFDVQLFAIAFLPVLVFGGVKYIGLFKSNIAKYFWLNYIFLAHFIDIIRLKHITHLAIN
jgi:Na+/alanine symporter